MTASVCRRIALWCVGLAVVAGAANSAASPFPYRVKDINQTPQPANSFPSSFHSLGGISLFTADDGQDGRELWRSDGTAAGTYELVDACAGLCTSDPRVVAVAGQAAFFTASSSLDGSPPTLDLWVTRGTSRDTFDLGRVGFASHPVWLASRGLLFFFGMAEGGYGLWRSDGTRAGTYLLTPIQYDANGNPGYAPTIVELGGRVYFPGNSANGPGLQGPALWQSDGTPAGTVPVWASDRPANTAGGPWLLRALGQRLIFLAPRPDGALSLWNSDGSSAAPFQIATPPADRSFVDVRAVGSRLFLAAKSDTGGELWATDGTAAGTRVLAALTMENPFPFGFDSSLVLPSGRLLFTATDGRGAEPWVTDGTPEGTHILLDICPGSCDSAAFFLQLPGAPAYFLAQDPGRGLELWVTDGTAAGTRLVRDVCPGACSSSPYGLSVFNGKTFFVARNAAGRNAIWRTDGTRQGTVRVTDLGAGSQILSFGYSSSGGLLFSGQEPVHGNELWRTDGTAAGTTLVRDIAAADLGGSWPTRFMSAGGKSYFFADDGSHGFELWTSDGTGSGTRLVKDLTPGAEPRHAPFVSSALESAGQLFFMLSAQPADLWRSNGTAAGTLRLATGDGAQGGPRPNGLAAMGKSVFYLGVDAAQHDALWKTDGTIAGTKVVSTAFSFPEGGLVSAGNRLYFAASGAEGGRRLWTSDGTAAGTIEVQSESFSSPDHLTAHAGLLYFFADDDLHGHELWRSNGTPAGTILVADLAPGSESFDPDLLISTGTRLFIIGSDESGQGLWATDGTAAGTRKLAILPGVPDSSSVPAVFQGRLYFALRLAQENGTELWASNGTPAGTGPVLDHTLQPVRSAGSLRALAHHLYFTRDGIPNLWQTDGTAKGTVPVAEPPKGYPSVLGSLWSAGSRLLFSGYDSVAGAELWALGPD